ncbi:MAG: TatD family hydrolase [Pseudomonadales bacterium]|nr:TatD family hydrolase [Pseudomonadales bacterium]
MYKRQPRTQQEAVFQFQIHLAIELNLPLFLHERDAHKRQLMILQEYSNELPNTVIHCFTGDKTALFNYLDLGCYIGITGWVCDERRGKVLQELVKQIPEDRLMIETDGPYLLPRNIKPKPKSRRNESKYLPHIANTIAQLREETVAAITAQTTANSRRFFSI